MSGGGGDDDKMWTPVKREDVTDLALLPGEMRAFRTEVRDELKSIARAITAFERIEAKIDVVIDRQNVFQRRLDEQQSQIDDLKRWQLETDQRLAEIERERRKAGKR